MKCVQSSENGLGGSTKRLSEVNEPKQDGKNEVGGGVVGQGQGRSEDGVLRVTKNSKDANHRPNASLVQPLGDVHNQQAQSQPQPQGKVVCWERFLPLRSLKVLLVESDDCTRHVVSALLRYCSYEVAAVSNGIEAWNFLTNLDNQIDLILTEVVMSGLSGISLLSKIMAHKSCRNIPVIMMSCYDSMGLVLKCLSNGAADFLVKPIRKNELKNLWQHVWRRCHSSSGSGSESGVGNEKSMTAKSVHESDNDTGSSEEDESRSFGLQGRDGSDNGSGTQSSWTKRAAEVNSPQPPSLSDQLADPPDSTCVQVIYPRSEAFASSWVPASMEECKGHNNKLDKFSMGKGLEIGLAKITEPQPKAPSIKENQSSQLDLNLKTDSMNLDKKLDISNDKQKGDTVNLPRDTISTFKHSKGSTGSGMPTALPELPKNKEEDVPKMPSMELSLNRLSDHTEESNVSEQNVLRHSELSAFTRYNSCSTANQGLTGNVGSCSLADNNSEAAKKPNSDSTPNQISNNSSNNIDMGSTTNRSSSKPVSAADKPPEKSILKCSNQTLGFQIAKTSPTSDSELMVSAKPNLGPANVKLQDGFSLKIMNGTVTEGGSLNSKGAPIDVNVVNYSVNGSVCGSNHGSNVQNGGSAAVNVDGMNMVHGNGIAANVCTDNGSGSGSGSGVGIDLSRSAQREAALIKFRQKRKERCFDKKVRYQSRKKLAEQRPRVRGQFIKQVQDNKAVDADS